MSAQLGIGLAAFLLACWWLYREHRKPSDLLPPPDKSCQRGSVEAVPNV